MTGSTVGTPSAMLTFLLIIFFCVFCFFYWHLLALIQWEGGGECARGRNRGRAGRDHAEASSSGMEAGGGVQSRS